MTYLTSERICGLIVTYNPEKDKLLTLIDSLQKQISTVIIIDNSSGKGQVDIMLKKVNRERIILSVNKTNVGIAKALNQGVEIAIKKGFHWVLLFDQDSIPFSNLAQTLCQIYNIYSEKNRIGAIGANSINQYNKKYKIIKKNKIFQERDYLITSGCLYPISIFQEIGGFREDFFIDNVDLEFSLRLKKKGKILLITNEVLMRHTVGFPKRKKIFGLILSSTNHSYLRRYYMARNNVLLSKSYFFSNPFFILKMNIFFFLSLFQIIFIERNKTQKIIISIKGILDGIFNRFNDELL